MRSFFITNVVTVLLYDWWIGACIQHVLISSQPISMAWVELLHLPMHVLLAGILLQMQHDYAELTQLMAYKALCFHSRLQT